MHGSTNGLLAAWASAFLQQIISLDDAIDAVLGHKASVVMQASATRQQAPWEAPTSVPRLVPEGETATLAELLLELRRQGASTLHAAFPISGDAGGVGPGPALAPAYDAGGAVLVADLGLVIVVTGEDDDTVEIQVFDSPCRVQYLSVSEATVELTEAVHASTSILSELDVASWNPRLGRVSRRALDDVGAPELPPGCPPRATHLLVRAHQVLELLDTASNDPGGGAVSSHEAGARDAALAPLRRHASRALGAAYNSMPPRD